ncbi:MAG: glycosyltransferase [Candidatus Marsarchaeota archaeon]|nr:glycosyltransferase [Candidatus Marsarchaeota archaeon]
MNKLKFKRIAWFSDTLEQNNGVAQYIDNIAPYLGKRMGLTVYAGRVTKPHNFNTVSLPYIKSPTTPDYDIILPTARKECDLVHAHSPYMLGLHAAKYEVPKIVTAHFLPQHTLEWFFGQKQPELFVGAGWDFEVWFLNLFDVVICQTHVGAGMFKGKGVKKPIHVIANGMKLEEFKKGNPKRFEEKFHVKDFALFVGRVDASKRPGWIIQAAKKLPHRHFVIAGTGIMLDSLEKPPNVHFIGRIARQDIVDAYHASNFVMMPSQAETEGLVAQEAMASGKPLIVSDDPVLDEVVGNAGIRCRNVDEFIDGVEELFENKKRYKELKEQATIEVSKRKIEESVEALEKLYLKMMD